MKSPTAYPALDLTEAGESKAAGLESYHCKVM
jgi:hypothetical protein